MDNLNKQLKELCQPLVDFLYENYHPHATIIIDEEHAEVVEGSMAVSFELRD